MSRFVYIQVLLVMTAATTSSAQSLTIMPFGDSITNGYHGPVGESGSYRHYLADMFSLMDFNFDFVGDMYVAANGLQDGNVQAHGGYAIERMLDEFSDPVKRHQPQVILALAGTNNHWSNPVFTEFVDRYTSLADMFEENSPGTQVIFATFPPFACCRDDKEYWTQEWVNGRNEVRIPNMNNALETVVGSRESLSLVDLNSVIDPALDLPFRSSCFQFHGFSSLA